MIIGGYEITTSVATFLLAIATAIMAVATAISVIFSARMSRYTKKLAIRNKELIEQNERHHMDDERPVLVIEHDANIEYYENRNIISILEGFENDCSKAIVNNYAKFIVNGALKNIGRGTALNPLIVVRFEGGSAKEIKADFPSLASGSSLPMGVVDFHASFDSEFLDQNNKFKATEYQTATGQSWEIFIAYHDIYGHAYYTRHPKNPQERWTTLGNRDEAIPQGKSNAGIKAELAALTIENYPINSFGTL